LTGVRTFLEIDHIVPFAEGGRTELANLWRTCSHHHHLKTYFGRRVVETPEGRDLVPP
jgi:5-methylcytosine-specific restriction endonuclease McrA